MHINLRPYRPSDRPALVALHAELQAYERRLRPSRTADPPMPDAYIADLEAQLADPEVDCMFTVAEVGSRLVGFVFCNGEDDMLEADADEVYVQDIMVTADARGLGLGRRLMEVVHAFAAERGIKRIVLNVLVQNASAMAFYERLGFALAVIGLEARTEPAS